MTRFQVLSYTHLLKSDPLKEQNRTCDTLEKQFSRGMFTLPQIWDHCVKDPSKNNNPERKNMSKEEKHTSSIKDCCESIMQCNNPNEWFKKNNIQASCIVSSPPVQPHFGDIQYSTHPMMYGVY
jgi:hypothetical protein